MGISILAQPLSESLARKPSPEHQGKEQLHGLPYRKGEEGEVQENGDMECRPRQRGADYKGNCLKDSEPGSDDSSVRSSGVFIHQPGWQGWQPYSKMLIDYCPKPSK